MEEYGTRQVISKPLLVVCGPTASGKTGLAVQLAKRFGGEVVSADSMQVYRQMSIGTAKPTEEEKEGVAHHLVDFLHPAESFSVAEYAVLAHQTIDEIHRRGKLPILAGGTGLYIQAVTDNIQFEEMASDSVLRAELQALADREGPQVLWDMLYKVDAELAEKLHPNNLGRVIRGIEVHRLTGSPLSKMQKSSRSLPGKYKLGMLGITYEDRQILYERINRRVDQMLDQGLLEEARELLENGYSKTASQAIGYKELFPYLLGEQGLEQAVENLKMQTRRYAKRQLTWFRRDTRINWLLADTLEGKDKLTECAVKTIQSAGLVLENRKGASQ